MVIYTAMSILSLLLLASAGALPPRPHYRLQDLHGNVAPFPIPIPSLSNGTAMILTGTGTAGPTAIVTGTGSLPIASPVSAGLPIPIVTGIGPPHPPGIPPYPSTLTTKTTSISNLTSSSVHTTATGTIPLGPHPIGPVGPIPIVSGLPTPKLPIPISSVLPTSVPIPTVPVSGPYTAACDSGSINCLSSDTFSTCQPGALPYLNHWVLAPLLSHGLECVNGKIAAIISEGTMGQVCGVDGSVVCAGDGSMYGTCEAGAVLGGFKAVPQGLYCERGVLVGIGGTVPGSSGS